MHGGVECVGQVRSSDTLAFSALVVVIHNIAGMESGLRIRVRDVDLASGVCA